MFNENQIPEAAEPTEFIPDSPESTPNHPEDAYPDETHKRNSGHTGPTTEAGRQTSARNATVHGMCAKTLILDFEHEADWLALFETWLDAYQNPAETSLLYTFVLKTAQAEWHRARIQRQYNAHLYSFGNPPVANWSEKDQKTHDLILRYLTTAERRFRSEYNMLEHHYKTHHKPQKTAPKPDPEPQPEERTMPDIRFVNCETGESMDEHGNEYPPPPDWKPRPIIPGVYGPKHPANPLNWPKEKPRRR
jgi:hypothetical protein